MRKIVIGLMVALAVLLAVGVSTTASATDDDVGYKVYTASQGAYAEAEVESPRGLDTYVSIFGGHDMIEYSDTAVRKHQSVLIYGLTIQEEGGYAPIWDFYAEGSPTELTFNDLTGARAVLETTAFFVVYDYNDADGDGDFYEVVLEFSAPIRLELDWYGKGQENFGGGCDWFWDGYEYSQYRYNGHGRQAELEGTLNGHDITGYGEIFEADYHEKYKPEPPAEPCSS